MHLSNKLVALFLLISITAAVGLAQTADRQPVPETAAQKKSQELIRSVFKEEYAQTGEANRKDLIATLLKNAAETRDDPPTRYMLLQEAMRLAVEIGEVDTALAALERMAAGFEIDPSERKIELVIELSNNASSAEASRIVTEMASEVAAELMAVDRFAESQKLAEAAERAARKSRDKDMLVEARELVTTVSEAKAIFDRIAPYYETLKSDPTDSKSPDWILHGQWNRKTLA